MDLFSLTSTEQNVLIASILGMVNLLKDTQVLVEKTIAIENISVSNN